MIPVDITAYQDDHQATRDAFAMLAELREKLDIVEGVEHETPRVKARAKKIKSEMAKLERRLGIKPLVRRTGAQPLSTAGEATKKRRWREDYTDRMRADGLCPNDGVPLAPDRSRCQRCLDKERNRQHRRRA